MPTIETMTLDEIDATLSALRTRRKALKSSSQTAQRKIVTLARRRERLMEQINALDEQIAQLRGRHTASPQAAHDPQRPRRRQQKVTACEEEILACVKRRGSAQRAAIVEECHLSPANATAYLRRLCADGKLIRHGEKSATTYSLPS